jgi:sugar diacid utilization regulator
LLNIGLETVSKGLKGFGSKLHISSPGNTSVNNTAYFDPSHEQYSPSLLYVCRASDLSRLGDASCFLNLLCISDVPLSQKLLDNEHLNFIVVDQDVHADELYDASCEVIASQIRLAEGKSKLSDALLTFKGLQYIVDTGCEVFGNPILVYDMSYKLLSYSQNITVDDERDPMWRQVTEKGYNPEGLIKVMKDKQFANVYRSESPVVFEKNDFIRYNWMASRIQMGWNAIGHVGVIEYDTPFDEDTAELLKHFAKVISSEMQKNSYVNYSKGILHESFLTDLLGGKVLNNTVLEERMRSLDISFMDDLYVFTVMSKPDSYENISLFYLRDLFATVVSRSKPIIYNNKIIAIVGRKKDRFLSDTESEEFAKYLKENEMVSGISRCFHDIAEMREYYEQSSMAIELGIRLDKESGMYFYEDYAIFHLLKLAENSKELKTFCSRPLMNLIEYDKSYHTDYMISLYEYLRCGRNLAEAAQDLNIHRNSMDYRIKKIEKIMDVDISDNNVLFSLNFSFKILKYTEGEAYLRNYKNKN